MTKSISVKELRTNLPKIRRELKKGVSFELIYRSKPIAEILPKPLKPTPRSAITFWANPPKSWLIKSKKGAVALIREERGKR